MEEKVRPVSNTCDLAGIRPAMMDLPYPPIRVRERNSNYANMLSVDYSGPTSEMSAITQYINNQNRLSCERCPLAKNLLEIAVAEMIHLRMLGELIYLLGGTVDFVAKPSNGKPQMWTPAYLNIPENAKKMIAADIESERSAIGQYKMHMSRMKDDYVKAVLRRIIKDEEYHIMILRSLMEECS